MVQPTLLSEYPRGARGIPRRRVRRRAQGWRVVDDAVERIVRQRRHDVRRVTVQLSNLPEKSAALCGFMRHISSSQGRARRWSRPRLARAIDAVYANPVQMSSTLAPLRMGATGDLARGVLHRVDAHAEAVHAEAGDERRGRQPGPEGMGDTALDVPSRRPGSFRGFALAEDVGSFSSRAMATTSGQVTKGGDRGSASGNRTPSSVRRSSTVEASKSRDAVAMSSAEFAISPHSSIRIGRRTRRGSGDAGQRG